MPSCHPCRGGGRNGGGPLSGPPGRIQATWECENLWPRLWTRPGQDPRQDFVRTARAKGLPRHLVTIRHTLRAALIPIVSTPYLIDAPWLSVAPGVAILLAVLAFNLIGDALRDVIDPRLRV